MSYDQAYQKEWYKKNKRRVSEQGRKYRRRPEVVAREKELRKQNRVHNLEWQKQWYQKNKARIKARSAKWRKEYYAKNGEKLREDSRRWTREHPERSREIAKKSYRKNIVKRKEGMARYGFSAAGKFLAIRYRAKRYGIPFAMTREEFTGWFGKKEKRCHYCDVRVVVGSSRDPKELLTIERKDNNGPYSLDNIVVSCKGCNVIKSNNISYETMLKIGQILRESREKKREF